MKIVNTDNYGGDYPNEKFVEGLPWMPEESLRLLCRQINDKIPHDGPRYFKVVPDDYKLQPGFEP